MLDSLVAYNTAPGHGGGFYYEDGPLIRVHRTTFEANVSPVASAFQYDSTSGYGEMINCSFLDHGPPVNPASNTMVQLQSGTFDWNCPLGTYAAASGNTPATDFYGCLQRCAAGFFGRGVIATCSGPCPKGHFCVEGTPAPEKCPEGTFMPTEGASSDESCFPCPAGSYNIDAGRAACEPCAAGTYAEDLRSTSCEPCAVGRYCPTAGASSRLAYKSCPAGTYNPLDGQRHPSACLPCPAGTASAALEATSVDACEPCSAGSFNPVLGQAMCRACEPGKFQEGENATACAECTPGHFCGRGSKFERECLAGTFSNATGLAHADDCQPSPLGFWAASGSTEPSPCRAGTRGTSERLPDSSFCTDCEYPLSSAAGSDVCSFCTIGYYSLPRGSDDASAECVECDLTMFSCVPNTSIETIELARGYWRLSDQSQGIAECPITADDVTRCKGGFEAGARGEGYCEDGYEGPLCTSCVTNHSSGAPALYFRLDDVTCTECPASTVTLASVGYFCLGLVALYLLLEFARRKCSRRRRRSIEVCLRSMWHRFDSFALLPKLKLLIAFYQSVIVLPTVYDVYLPEQYYEWTSFLDFVDLDWANFFLPAGCFGSYLNRLLYIGLAPLAGLGMVLLLSWLISLSLHYVAPPELLRDSSIARFSAQFVTGAGERPCLKGVYVALPLVLFISFCLCAGTSTDIFRTWDCVSYDNSTRVEASSAAYLRSYVDLQCWTQGVEGPPRYTAEYQTVLAAGFAFVVVWPIGMPLLYLILLLPQRRLLRERHTSPLSRATAFLHREYQPSVFFWEPVFMLQRILIVGFVQLFPASLAYFRLLFAVLVTVLYLVVLMLLKPYKRDDVNHFSMGTQALLVCVFMAAQTLRLYNELQDLPLPNLSQRILGFSSADQLVLMMILFNLAILLVVAFVTTYQIAVSKGAPLLRLKQTGEPPDLTLDTSCRYHLFLSHTWSSAQDQAALIKRQLQRFLPGARIFLDVDDLEDATMLPAYVAASQCVLIMLSRGYFHSKACLIEFDAVMALKKPFVLVHESDTSRGGAPIADLREDCALKRPGAETIFDRHEIINWKRVHDYQKLSLKLIAQRMCHAMPEYSGGDNAPPLYMRSEITRTQLVFSSKVSLFVSEHNPGAWEFAAELIAKYRGGSGSLAGLRIANDLTSARGATPLSPSGASCAALQPPLSPSALDAGAAAAAGEQSPAASVQSASQREASVSRKRNLHMLLYLSHSTFVGEAGELLAEQVRDAMRRKVPICLVHENDLKLGGCAFHRFFQTTPQDLIDDHLYRKIANACHPPPFREVSLALIAKSLGAEPLSTRLGACSLFLKRESSNKAEKAADGSRAVARQVSQGASARSPFRGKRCNSSSATPAQVQVTIDRSSSSAGVVVAPIREL